MLPGLDPGRAVEIEIVVTTGMAPHFDGALVHPVYSTWSLVHHMEIAGRKLLVPHLEPHEEGLGGGIEVTHRSPALIGTRVRVRAEVESCERGRLIALVSADAGGRLLADGRFLQVILPKTKVNHLFERYAGDVATRAEMPENFRHLLGERDEGSRGNRS